LVTQVADGHVKYYVDGVLTADHTVDDGQRKHNGHLWQANWWTQGSEPGVTAQWKDLGAC